MLNKILVLSWVFLIDYLIFIWVGEFELMMVFVLESKIVGGLFKFFEEFCLKSFGSVKLVLFCFCLNVFWNGSEYCLLKLNFGEMFFV